MYTKENNCLTRQAKRKNKYERLIVFIGHLRNKNDLLP